MDDYGDIPGAPMNIQEQGGAVDGVFSGGFNGAPRSEMYREWTSPGMFPHEPQPVLSNWDDEELEMFCGIYTDDRKEELRSSGRVRGVVAR